MPKQATGRYKPYSRTSSSTGASAKQRYASLQQLFSWIELEDEIEHSPFAKINLPNSGNGRYPSSPNPSLPSRGGRNKEFESVRDHGILRTVIDPGCVS